MARVRDLVTRFVRWLSPSQPQPAHRPSRLRVETLEDRTTPAPVVLDPTLEVRTVATGLTAPTSMAFLSNRNADDLLVLEKNSGRVERFVSGFRTTVLDLAVNNFSERGLLGIALHPDFHDRNPRTPQYVYLYWTESTTGADTNVPSATPLMGNRVDRFVWNGTSLTFDRPIIQIRAIQQDAGQPERGNHDGGVIRFGPDGKLYVIIGDLGRRGFTQNVTTGLGPNGDDDQFGGPETDAAHLSGVVLRLNPDGSTPRDNPFFQVGRRISQAIGPAFGEAVQKIFAYGIRNSFGMAFDPESGRLWTAENGDDSYSEVNLVQPGFNGGWVQVMGPISRVADFKLIETGGVNPAFRGLQQIRFDPSMLPDTPDEARASLFQLPGSRYTDPQFSWRFEVAPVGLGFMNGRGLGREYEGDLFMGAAVPVMLGGPLFHFDLSGNRRSLDLDDPRLADRVADNVAKHEPTESESLLFGYGFGVVTDTQTGPNGNLFLVSASSGQVYEIRKREVPPPAGEKTFFAILTGSQEVTTPPGGTGTSAAGIARFTLSADGTQLRYEISIFGLDLGGTRTPTNPADDVGGVHIHRAPAGSNGPVVFGMIGPDTDLDGPLVNGPEGLITGDWDLTEGNAGATLATELDDLFAEGLYLNVHTERFPGGEIRGQIRRF